MLLVDTVVAESDRKSGVRKKHEFSLSVENERADAERDGRTWLARSNNSQARTGMIRKRLSIYFPFSADHKNKSYWQPYLVGIQFSMHRL